MACVTHVSQGFLVLEKWGINFFQRCLQFLYSSWLVYTPYPLKSLIFAMKPSSCTILSRTKKQENSELWTGYINDFHYPFPGENFCNCLNTLQFSWLTLGLTVGEAGNKPNTLPAYRIDANTFSIITKTSNCITKWLKIEFQIPQQTKKKSKTLLHFEML